MERIRFLRRALHLHHPLKSGGLGSGGFCITQQGPSGTSRTTSDRMDAARLGNPSLVWRFGQRRRLAIIERYLPLTGRRVLDLGCGVGEYVRGFENEGADSLGCDIEWPRLLEAKRRGSSNLVAAAGEALPFQDGSIDIVVLNEVIEHVADDRTTLHEVARVLAADGHCVIFAPNRLYPFETHGIRIGQRYFFGNIPFINWLPKGLRDHLVPHARVYGHNDWNDLIEGSGLRILVHSYVYPGFDNIATRAPRIAGLLRTICYRSEHTLLRRFGLSHLLVLNRTSIDPAIVSARPPNKP